MRNLVIQLWFLVVAIQTHGAQFKRYEENGKVGLKDDQGAVVLPPAFEALGWSDGSFSVIGQITGYKRNGSWGLINLKEEYITKAEFESLVFAGADRVVAVKIINGIMRKAGSLTITGKVSIPFQYDAITLYGMRAVVMNKIGIDYRFGLTDLENHILLPIAYNNIYPVGTLRFAVENLNGKLALFSDDGKPVTDFFIDSLSNFHRHHAIIFSNGLQGILDRSGRVVIKPAYHNIQFQDDGSLRALQPNTWKVIDDKNLLVQSFEADGLLGYGNKFYLLTQSGRQGLLDTNWQLVWPVDYDCISPMINGLIPAKKNKKWGLLSIDQKERVEFSYDSLTWDGEFAQTLTYQLGKSQWALLNVKDNHQSTKTYDAIEKINSHYFKVRKNGYYGLVSREGKEKVHCVYDSILELRGNQVAVQFRQQHGIISTNEEWILAPQRFPVQLVNEQLYLEQQPGNTFLKSFSGNLIYFTPNPILVLDDYLFEKFSDGTGRRIGFDGVGISREMDAASIKTSMNFLSSSSTTVTNGLRVYQSQGKFGFRDERGRLMIPNRYDSVKPFRDGLAAFKLVGKWGYISPEDKFIIHPSFDFAGDFVNGFAVASKKNKFGLIDKAGQIRLEFRYDSIVPSNDKLLLYLSGKEGLANAAGKILVEPRYDRLRILANGQILVNLHQKFGIITSDGLNLIPIIYSSIEYDKLKNLYLAHLTPEWTVINLR